MRALRRSHDERMKAKARRVMRIWSRLHPGEPDARKLGVNASTHCRPCSCWMCSADRKEVPAKRERPFHHPEG